ncbi:hypothetical protein [Terrabacter sp. BE26]|uniref:hypothetical protein n=1 Tax=Terrabacter sp. BE26 TaxID=2898152 RepID=UPI0035BE1852
MELQDETRDGLRIFSVDAGRETTRATLFFRVGQADETLPTSGWTHLLEHLALHDWNDPRLAFNASVGLFLTRFEFDGETEAVLEHLGRLARWFADPDLTRLGHEAKVLRAESEQRPVGNVVANLEWRYGARGPGLPAYRELGLCRATEVRLREWCAEVFCAENAVFACDTPVPHDVRIALPRGRGRPAALPPQALDTLPAVHRVRGGLVCSAVVTRSVAAGLAPDVLVRALTRALRELEGTSYAPWADLERIDADTALLVFGADVSTEGSATCGLVLNRCLRELAERGPDQALLDEMTVSRSRHFRDEQQAPAVAWAAAVATLTGHEVRTAKETEALAAQVTPNDLCMVFSEVRRTLLLGLPEESRLPSGFQEAGHRRWETLDATSTHAHVDGVSRILLGPKGIQYSAPSSVVTVLYSDLAGLITYPDGARRAVSGDGWTVVVEPSLLRRGDAVTAALDANAPASVVLPQPARPADEVPSRPPLPWRARRRTRSALRPMARLFERLPVSGWVVWLVVFLAARAVYAYVSSRP